MGVDNEIPFNFKDLENSISQEELAKLLSQKDASIDLFLQKMMSLLKLPINATPDEIQTAWSNQLSDKISDMSAILWHRLNPYVQILIQKKISSTIQGQMVCIESFIEPLKIMVEKYNKCFNGWIDSDKVSFNTGNQPALGKLSMKDYFILQLFTMGTCTRKRGDNCLMLGIVGKSTVGKSLLFEAPLLEVSHMYVAEKGVGRFKIENKTILFFHDVDVNTFIHPKDRDLIKTVCRTEPTAVKVHSSVSSIPPVHVLYTSNTFLFNHKVKGNNIFSSSFLSDIQITPKNVEHVQAIRCRFLECFCSEKPDLNSEWFPECGMFQRQHMILGIFDRVMKILSKYPGPESFYRVVQVHYVLAGLAKNAKFYEELFQISVVNEIECFVKKFIKNVDQQNDVLNLMK